MVSSRDKLKDRGLVQIAVWLSQDSAALLKRLAAERGQSATKVVEQAIAALAGQPTEPTEPPTSAPDVSGQLAELSAALEGVTARLAALEAPSAPVAVATDAEALVESSIAEIGLPVASVGIPEPGVVRVFAELPDGEKAGLVAVMRDWHDQGLSLRKIGAAMFEQHSVGTDSGKPLWQSQVQKIING